MKLPKNSIKYILFQRTGYLKNNLLFKLLSWLGNHKLFYKPSINLKAVLFAKQIKKEFSQDMQDEYTKFKPFLPATANSILDIGCGVAGIDILISQHYQHQIDVFLIDKTQIDKKVYYYFEKQGSFYNSLEVSKTILENNGINPDKIHLQEATEDNIINFNQTFDVVISLISWGYHYPVATYLNEVYEKLNRQGVLIIDVRKNTGGLEEIKQKFGNYQIIFEDKKFNRVLVRK